MSCTHGGPIPKWDGKLYAGDSKHAGIARAQSGEFIPATDPIFDKFLAMTYEDFRKLYATYVLSCKEWREGVVMMKPSEALDRFAIGMKDLEDAKKFEIKEDIKATE